MEGVEEEVVGKKIGDGKEEKQMKKMGNVEGNRECGVRGEGQTMEHREEEAEGKKQGMGRRKWKGENGGRTGRRGERNKTGDGEGEGTGKETGNGKGEGEGKKKWEREERWGGYKEEGRRVNATAEDRRDKTEF